MPSLFENKLGYVTIVPGTATKALLRVQSIDGGGAQGFLNPDVIFVTQFSIQRGINSNVSYSLDNRIFLSAAGDRLGSLKLQGLIFGSACGGATSADYGSDHGGFLLSKAPTYTISGLYLTFHLKHWAVILSVCPVVCTSLTAESASWSAHFLHKKIDADSTGSGGGSTSSSLKWATVVREQRKNSNPARVPSSPASSKPF